MATPSVEIISKISFHFKISLRSMRLEESLPHPGTGCCKRTNDFENYSIPESASLQAVTGEMIFEFQKIEAYITYDKFRCEIISVKRYPTDISEDRHKRIIMVQNVSKRYAILTKEKRLRSQVLAEIEFFNTTGTILTSIFLSFNFKNRNPNFETLKLELLLLSIMAVMHFPKKQVMTIADLRFFEKIFQNFSKCRARMVKKFKSLQI